MTKLAPTEIDVAGGQIHAVVEGEGPLVLLVHGFPEGCAAAVVAAEYRDHRRTVRPQRLRRPVEPLPQLTRDWGDLAAFDDPCQPTLFITGEHDSTRLWLGDAIGHQGDWLPGHTGTHIIPGCGHWVQQQRPEQVNALLLDFLS